MELARVEGAYGIPLAKEIRKERLLRKQWRLARVHYSKEKLKERDSFLSDLEKVKAGDLSPDHRDEKSGKTMLTRAYEFEPGNSESRTAQRLAYFKQLLQLGANPNLEPTRGQYPTHLFLISIATRASKPFAEAMLQHGVDRHALNYTLLTEKEEPKTLIQRWREKAEAWRQAVEQGSKGKRLAKRLSDFADFVENWRATPSDARPSNVAFSPNAADKTPILGKIPEKTVGRH